MAKRSGRCLVLATILAAGFCAGQAGAAEHRMHLPYAAAGLDERQAAAFLLDRLTFGPTPGQVDAVVTQGLEQWVRAQLEASAPETALEEKLQSFPAVGMTHQQLFERYPSSSLLQAHVRRYYDMIPPAGTPVDFTWVSRRIAHYRQERGLKVQEVELRGELVGQKVMRALHAQNQLQEVLTDFWFNHFYTTPTHFRARPWIMSYENDVIRANALGKFGDLLLASAKHPAMRDLHADGASRATIEREDSTFGRRVAAARPAQGASTVAMDARAVQALEEIDAMTAEEDLILPRQFWPKTGPNEAYVRVLFEQQTLGGKGGYTSADVADTARALTGWTTRTRGPSGEWFKQGLAAASDFGFVEQGSFLFRADWHDAGAKRILGKAFPAGGGLEEGERVLRHVASQPATARHIAHKLAVRFVADAPSDALVSHLARTFQRSHGDVRAMVVTLLESPEFWRAAPHRTKIKTPFEYAISALRATRADVTDARGVIDWTARMGQQVYGQLGPVGFPDRGDYWLNAATLAGRIEFATALNAGQIEGVHIDLAARPGDDSAYVETLIPGRDVGPMLDALRSVVPSQFLAVVIAAPQFQVR
jgi:uncharacterized protein (DUF1800 family)